MLTATFLAYEKELEANIDHVFYLEPKLSLYVGVFSNSPYHDFGCIYLRIGEAARRRGNDAGLIRAAHG